MARSVSKFIYRTAMATALLGFVGMSGLAGLIGLAGMGSAGINGLDAAYAAPAGVAQANTAGPGWAAVGQLLQTFEGAGASKVSKSAAKATAKSASKVASDPSSLIDYQEMSVRCLGKKDWDSLTVSQRTQFVASLKGLVEQRYYPRWRKIFGKGKVTFQEETSQGCDILVRTKLLLGKKDELLSWRVAERSGAQKIVSLSVANNDLLERLKSRIKARQKKVGFDALLAWMKGRSNDDSGISSGSALALGSSTHGDTLSD